MTYPFDTLIDALGALPRSLDDARDLVERRLAPRLAHERDFYEAHAHRVVGERDAALGRLAEAHRARADLADRISRARHDRDVAVRQRQESGEALAGVLDECAAERDKATTDAKRLAGECDRMGRAIAAALSALVRVDAPHLRINDALTALRSVAWGEPDGAEAEEPASVCDAVCPDGVEAAGLRCARLAGHLTEHFARDENGNAHGWPRDPAALPEEAASVVQKACDRCTLGVMDANNPHLRGLCKCSCHEAPPIPDTPAPRLTCAGAEACERGEELRALRAECEGWKLTVRERDAELVRASESLRRLIGEHEALRGAVLAWLRDRENREALATMQHALKGEP